MSFCFCMFTIMYLFYPTMILCCLIQYCSKLIFSAIQSHTRCCHRFQPCRVTDCYCQWYCQGKVNGLQCYQARQYPLMFYFCLKMSEDLSSLTGWRYSPLGISCNSAKGFTKSCTWTVHGHAPSREDQLHQEDCCQQVK